MRKQEFWVARDGKPFTHPVECRQYEAELDLRDVVNKEFGSYTPPGLVDWLLRNYVLMPRAVVDGKPAPFPLQEASPDEPWPHDLKPNISQPTPDTRAWPWESGAARNAYPRTAAPEPLPGCVGNMPNGSPPQLCPHCGAGPCLSNIKFFPLPGARL